MRDTSGRRRDVTRFSPVTLNTQGRALPDRTGQRALDAVLSAAANIRIDLDDALSDSARTGSADVLLAIEPADTPSRAILHQHCDTGVVCTDLTVTALLERRPTRAI